MAQRFDAKEARLLLEICRYTYAAGVGDQANAADRAETLTFIKDAKGGDPVGVRGEGNEQTSFAVVVPFQDHNVVAYMGTQTEFDGLTKKHSVLDLFGLFSDLQKAIVSLLDWEQNVEARPVKFELDAQHLGKATGITLPDPVRVHHGFLDELKAVQAKVVETLKQHGGLTRPVVVTGHSQGGAEAALATKALAEAGFNVQVTYTFAAPRAGNQAFVDSVTTPVHRIEFGNDIVPHLPPAVLRPMFDEFVEEHPKAGRVVKTLLATLEDHGYVGLGPLCYGSTDAAGKTTFNKDMSAAEEQALFEERLKLLPKHVKDWGDHHHLAGTTEQTTARPPVRGNYSALVSPWFE